MTSLARHLLVLALCWLSTGAVALAQDDATRAAAARAVFAEGVAAADAEDWPTAVERFERARALRSSPTIALNLGIALGHLGRVVEAVELLRAASRDAGASEAVRASAAQTLPELEPRIAWVRLAVSGASDATILVDGRPLAPELMGEAIPLDPGEHRFAASRAEAEVASTVVTLAEGERTQATLIVPEPPPELPAIEPPLPPIDEELAPPPPEPSSGPDPLALGLGIGGGVIVLGGVVTLVLVLALPSQAAPFVGNAGVIQVGP